MDKDIIIGGVSALLLIPALVQGFKMLGYPDKYAPHLALVLSLIAAIVSQLVQTFPGIEAWVAAVVGGLIVWLVATGVYHTFKNITGNDHTGDASTV